MNKKERKAEQALWDKAYDEHLQRVKELAYALGIEIHARTPGYFWSISILEEIYKKIKKLEKFIGAENLN